MSGEQLLVPTQPSPIRGLVRMDEPITDVVPGTSPAALPIFPGENSGQDIAVQDQARPSQILLGRPYTVEERDPFSFDKVEFRNLHPAMQDGVSLALMRDIPWEVMQQGMNGDENEKSEAQKKLEELRDDFELSYRLSKAERDTFGFFDRYFKGRLTTWDEEFIDDFQEHLERLDLEKKAIEKGERRYPRPVIEGFKLARYDRWVLEEQIRREREEAERIRKVPSPELPKAA